MNDFLIYFKLGLTHVLDWQAYDHVLFLAALVAAYTFYEWKRVLGLVTVFTVGHTLSLTLAAYQVVNVNSAWVEFLIPVTILITAFYNLFTAGKKKPNRGVSVLFFTTLAFGIIHGLGFSSYFNEIIAVGAQSKLLVLLEFALGIEGAQLIVVLIVLILAFIFQSLFRFSKRDWVLVVSALIIGRVIPMLLENKIW